MVERLQAVISESDDNMIKLIVIVMKQFTRRTLRKRVINVQCTYLARTAAQLDTHRIRIKEEGTC